VADNNLIFPIILSFYKTAWFSRQSQILPNKKRGKAALSQYTILKEHNLSISTSLKILNDNIGYIICHNIGVNRDFA
jgi:hypothetical protein